MEFGGNVNNDGIIYICIFSGPKGCFVYFWAERLFCIFLGQKDVLYTSGPKGCSGISGPIGRSVIIGPKAVLKIIQHQTNDMNSIFTNALLCIMF